MADIEYIPTKRFLSRKNPLPSNEILFAEANRIYAYSEVHRGLIWKAHKNPLRPWPKLGVEVGGDDGHGYRMCLVLGHKFKVHQIVWLLSYGAIPKHSLDHIDLDKRNNQTSNLRPASDLQNTQNQRNPNGKLSGVKRYKQRSGFSAVVQHLGKKIYFGYFKTEQEAHDAYVLGKKQICGEFSPVSF